MIGLSIFPNQHMHKFLLPLLLISTSIFAQDNPELYTFANPTYQARFNHLTNELRCLVCQNETLADSNAPFAKDMRKQLLMMLNQGLSDEQITQFLIQRYGEFITYNPAFNHSTFLLWVSPLMLLIISILFFRRQFKIPANNRS